MSDRTLQLADSARERAVKLRKLAKQAEAITWRPEAVMRENASLLLTLSSEIERLSAFEQALADLVDVVRVGLTDASVNLLSDQTEVTVPRAGYEAIRAAVNAHLGAEVSQAKATE